MKNKYTIPVIVALLIGVIYWFFIRKEDFKKIAEELKSSGAVKGNVSGLESDFLSKWNEAKKSGANEFEYKGKIHSVQGGKFIRNA